MKTDISHLSLCSAGLALDAEETRSQIVNDDWVK